jgi:hypothetical protein
LSSVAVNRTRCVQDGMISSIAVLGIRRLEFEKII